MLHRMIDDVYPTMPWDSIDAVVFDVGRVLLDFQPEKILARYLPDAPELHETLLRRVFRSPYWVMMDRGTLTHAEATEALAGSDEQIGAAVRHIMAHWVEMKDVLDEGVRAMACCKAHGKKIYILSNYGDEPFRVVEEKYDFFRLADEKFISSRLKLLKPEPAIYAHVIRATGHDPERVLFIDDASANIEGALAAGWQGLCYLQPGQLDRFFQA